MLFNPLKKEILHATWRKTLTTLAVMMIALPAHAACSNNEDGNPGQNGEIEYFTANDTLYYCDDTDWIAMRDFANSYRTVPVTFDGTTTFLNGASNLHPDTAQWTGSFWIKPTGPSENQEIFTSAGNAGNPSSGATIIRLRANDNLFFRSRSASGIIMNLHQVQPFMKVALLIYGLILVHLSIYLLMPIAVTL